MWLILGVVVIVDSMITQPTSKIQWIVGMVLLGLIPVDSFLTRRRDRGDGRPV